MTNQLKMKTRSDIHMMKSRNATKKHVFCLFHVSPECTPHSVVNNHTNNDTSLCSGIVKGK